MSKSLPIVNTAADTFSDVFTKINNILTLANTEIVTANSTGAVTSGNGFVNGVFGSNTLAATTIRGGNSSTTGSLTITANTMTLESISIGNSTVNSVANSTEATITTVKATTVNVGANVSVNTTSLKLGNSTVNSSMNSSTIQVPTVLATQINVGANVSVNTSVVSVGNIVANGTALIVDGNSTLNSSALHLGNSTVNATVNSTVYSGSADNALNLGGVPAADYQLESGLAANVATMAANNASYLGGVVAAAYIQNTDSRTLSGNLVFSGANIYITTKLSVGDNVVVDTSSLSLGNSTINTFANSSYLLTAVGVFSTSVNVGSNVSLDLASLKVGNSTVNSLVNSTVFSLNGGQAQLNSSSLKLGNSTVNVSVNTISAVFGGNAQVNSTVFAVGNSTVNSSMNSSTLTTPVVSATNVAASQLNVSPLSVNSTVVGIGANVTVNTSTLYFGNSSVNSSMNSSTIRIDTAIISNLNINTVTISESFNVVSGHFQSQLTVGGNVIVNTSVFALGNSTVNTAVNSSFIVTKTGQFTSYVNTPSIVVGDNVSLNTGSLKIGNSTVNSVVNSSAIVVPVITVTNVSASLVNVGSNVSLNTSILKIGNSTVNTTVNSTMFSGTSDNALNLGGVAAADYQLESGLAANVATMAANNASYLGGVIAASYQLNSTLAANVATMDSNNASYLGGTAAASYVKNTDSRTLSGNLVFSGANVVFSSGAKVGANVTVTTSSISIGNSTVNTYIDNDQVTIGIVQINSSTFQAFDGLSIMTANSSVVSVPTVSTQNITMVGVINVGSNVSLNNSTLKIGNSTSFINVSKSGVSLYSNSTESVSIVFEDTGNPATLTRINSRSVSTNLVTSNVSITTFVSYVGENVVISTSGLSIGNSTVNTQINSTSVISRSLNVGSTFSVNATQAFLGNTTVVIEQQGAADALIVRDVLNDTSPFVIDQAGTIIKGANASLGSTFSSQEPVFQIIGAGAATSHAGITCFNSGAGQSPVWTFARSRNNAVGTFEPVASGTIMGRIRFMGSNSTGFYDAAEIRSVSEATGTNTITETSLRFYTSNSSVASGESMRINQEGNVGIRNTAPSHTLSLGGVAGHGGSLYLGNSTANATITALSFAFGNTTGNISANTTALYVAGSSGQLINSVFIGYNVAGLSTGINSSGLFHSSIATSGNLNFSSHQLTLGTDASKVIANSTTYFLGNSTVNAVMNSSTLTIFDVVETSDIAAKENVEYLNTEDALAIVSSLKGAKYNLKTNPSRQTFGLIAQDVEDILPQVVYQGDMKSLKYSAIIPILVEAIKELKAEIDRLKK